jgi:exosortase B
MTAAIWDAPPKLLAKLAPWIIVAVGMFALYVPTIIDLFNGLWTSEEQGHGPIVLCLTVWMIWRKRAEVLEIANSRPAPLIAWPLLVLGAVSYALGRSQGSKSLEVGSAIAMVAGTVLLLRGRRQLNLVAFPIFFMFFLIPLPGTVVAALTGPMKMAVSYVTELILHQADYPISRTGAIIQIGPYQMLVADACAGLNTLLSLEALGLFYLNIVRYASLFRNIALGILIVPISFAANVTRVIALTLITYHFGDDAGQGFLHGFSGMVLFVSALMLTILADSLLRLGITYHKKQRRLR